MEGRKMNHPSDMENDTSGKQKNFLKKPIGGEKLAGLKKKKSVGRLAMVSALILFTLSIFALGAAFGAVLLEDESKNLVERPAENGYEDEEDMVAEEDSDAIECELTTFSDPNYPDFSFDYEDCRWDIAIEELPRENDPDELQVLLTSLEGNELEIRLNALPVFGSEQLTCKSAQYAFAVTSEGVPRGRYFDVDSDQWLYYSELLTEGTPEFDEARGDEAGFADLGYSTGDTVCFSAEIPFVTQSSFIVPAELGGDGTSTMSTIVSPMYRSVDGMSDPSADLSAADLIIYTMQVGETEDTEESE